MKLIARIEWEVESEDEFERLREASKLPNETWKLIKEKMEEL